MTTLHGPHCFANGTLVCGWPNEHREANVQAAVGDIVAYEDQANPRTLYRVVRYLAGYGGQYELAEVETEEVTYSDLRQAGWTLVNPAPICRLRNGRCETHNEADTVAHHFATHPNATMD